MKNLFYTMAALLLPLWLTAQTPFSCINASEIALQQARLRRNVDALPTAAQRSVTYVPLRFHLVGETDGTGRIKMRRVLDQLCSANDYFLDGNIQFYLYGSDLFGTSINSTLVYDQPLESVSSLIMQNHKEPAAINIYSVGVNSDWASPLGDAGAYFSPLQNWIVLARGTESLGNIHLISHELGHYFSLVHPFFGWDLPFNSSYPGWPQAPDAINGYPVELMDGSNCTVAGDMICDTPPDYMLGTFDCAPYTGGALDPNGELVDPMENNIMSYFFGCPDFMFTPGQFDVMTADLNSPDQANLDLNFTPAATEIITPPDLLVSPTPSFYFPGNTNIQLDWLDVAGATHYLVELDITPLYTTPLSLEYITTESQLLVPQALSPNKIYHWSVRPFNAYVGCAETMDGVFRTGPSSTSVQTLTDGSTLEAAPNPVSVEQSVQVRLSLARAAVCKLGVIDASGRLLAEEVRQLPSGESTWPLSAETLAPGLNWIRLEVNGQTALLEIVRQ